jgi:hypothetical protein
MPPLFTAPVTVLDGVGAAVVGAAVVVVVVVDGIVQGAAAVISGVRRGRRGGTGAPVGMGGTTNESDCASTRPPRAITQRPRAPRATSGTGIMSTERNLLTVFFV